jgi:hypothetical protein
MLHDFDEFLGKLKGVVDCGNGRGLAVCPCNDSHELTFAVGHERQLVVRCDPRHLEDTACTTNEIMRRVGVDPLTLQPWRNREMAGANERPTEEAVHQYYDQDSNGKWYLAYEVLRLRFADGSKNMPQRVPNPQYDPKKRAGQNNKQHIYGLNGQRPVLYRVKQLREGLKAGPTRWVFVQEGEVKVEMCHDLGLLSTCCPMGASKWNQPWYKTELQGANVIVIPDEDKTRPDGTAAGLEHAKQVVRDLFGTAATVRIVRVPEPEFGGYGFEDWRKQKGDKATTTKALMELVNSFSNITDLKQLDALKPFAFPVKEEAPASPPPPPAQPAAAAPASTPPGNVNDTLVELAGLIKALNASSPAPRSVWEWFGEIECAKRKFDRVLDAANPSLVRELGMNLAAAIVRGVKSG